DASCGSEATRSIRKPSRTLNVLIASAGSFGASRGIRSLSDCGGSAANSATAVATMKPVTENERVVMCRIMADARGEGNHQSSGRSARLKQVADLRQQLLVLGHRRHVGLLFTPHLAQP